MKSRFCVEDLLNKVDQVVVDTQWLVLMEVGT